MTKDLSPDKAAREARLAAALRDNLKRRKSQARGLAGQPPDEQPGLVLSGPARRRPDSGKP